MPTPKSWSMAAAGALLVSGVLAFLKLYLYSVETGDVFPEYSSLRADPRGVKALHDAIAALPGYRVERSFRSVSELKVSDATLLYLSSPVTGWRLAPAKAATEWEKHARRGLRIVIAFAEGRSNQPDKRPPGALEAYWRLRLASTNSQDWPVAFQLSPGDWRVLREEAGQPVVIERSFDSGSIVLSGGSFLFSNEGLRRTRDTGLLALTIGENHRVIFDEAHLGVVQTGSVGALLRRYRLQAAAFVLVLAGLLFVWRAGTPFLPPATRERDVLVTGRDSSAALTSLLRRSISGAGLAGTALELWRKSARLDNRLSQRRRQDVEAALSRADRQDQLRLWQEVHRMLNTKS
jgi:hypothetical protein